MWAWFEQKFNLGSLKTYQFASQRGQFNAKDNKTSKIRIKLRKMILDNSDKGSVKRKNHFQHTSEIIDQSIAFKYPL